MSQLSEAWQAFGLWGIGLLGLRFLLRFRRFR